MSWGFFMTFWISELAAEASIQIQPSDVIGIHARDTVGVEDPHDGPRLKCP